MHKTILADWLHTVVEAEEGAVSGLSYVFCTDSALLEINIKYLKTNNLTDVIAFDLSNGEGTEGEVYISMERITENAIKFNNTVEQELHRVMIHGLLHLLGYTDKSKSMKDSMTTQEDLYLSLLSKKF
ncbi:MAG: rRNA maturation RNase YbeY [Bacteroidetes bacterium]|nr:MAG: rRNA maturation RNase YbeY [Bacteroidota bacterium]